MKLNQLFLLITVLILFGCSKPHLFQSWYPVFVQEDISWGGPKATSLDALAFDFKSRDTLSVYNIRSGIQINIPIIFTSDNTFYLETRRENSTGYIQILQSQSDSLTLQYRDNPDSLVLNDVYIKYISLPSSQTTLSNEEIKFILLDNYWEATIDSFRYEFEFQFQQRENDGLSGDYEQGYDCIIHQYDKNQYKTSLAAYWNIQEINSTYILNIGHYDDYLFHSLNEFFIIKSDTDSTLQTISWYQNKKRNITFKKKYYDFDPRNSRYNDLRGHSFRVYSIDTIPKYNPDLIDLGILDASIDGFEIITDTSLLLLKRDFRNQSIIYSFLDNGGNTYVVYKHGKEVNRGTWHLHPNGKLLELKPFNLGTKVQNYNRINGGFIEIIHLSEDSLVLFKREDIYFEETDSFDDWQTKQVWKPL